jgi:type I restriction enzyme S subunit
MSDLPENWIATTLGKVCAKPQYGWTSKAAQRGRIKYLRTTDLSSGVVDWNTVPYCLDEPDDIEKYQVEDNDIVISRAGSVGLSYRIENPPPKSVFASYLIRMRATSVEHRYLEFFLKSSEYWKQISDVSAGIAVQNINATKLSDLEIPLAPRSDQKLIVAKLDTLFAHLDELKARLEKIPTLLKQFRQGVLKQAVTGKLTEQWRSTNGIREGQIKGLGELGKVLAGQSPKSSEVNLDGQGELYVTGPEQWDGKKIRHGKWTMYPKSIAPKDSIFVTVKGAGVGKTFPGIKAAIGRDIYAFVPDKYNHHKYVMYAIQASVLDVISKAKGLIPGLTKSDLTDHQIYRPEIEEQEEIVNRVDALFALADKVEANYETLWARIDQLPQAILAKAFRGELVKGLNAGKDDTKSVSDGRDWL